MPKVNRDGPIPEAAPELGPCWLWLGYIRDDYPWMYYEGRPVAAYRVAYLLFNDPIPDGYQVDHLCRVTCCVNPAHLEAVTQQENIRRQLAAITHCPQGHLYSPENTAYYTNGAAQSPVRRCRQCSRDMASRGRKRIPDRQCEACGQTYKPSDYRQRFCSKICGQARRKLHN